MNQTLVIIGNKEKTNLFVVNRAMSGMEKVETINNPNARKRERDLVSDSPGRVVKGNGLGSRSIGADSGALEHLLEQYANNILEYVQKNNYQQQDSKIVLVSEPGFLGLLKKHFKTADISISKTIAKELIHLDDKSIFSKIKEEI